MKQINSVLKNLSGVLFLLITAGGYPIFLSAADIPPTVSLYARDLFVTGEVTSPVLLKKSETAEWEKAGWHARTVLKIKIADTEYLNDGNSGAFGELSTSLEGKDIQDIRRFDKGLFWLIFPHSEWKEGKGDYSTDYHNWESSLKKKGDFWTFQIKSSEPKKLKNASIEISLDGPYVVSSARIDGKTFYKETAFLPKMLSEFTLIDVDRHKSYSYDMLSKVQFKMENKAVRTFRWVRGKIKDIYAPTPVTIPQAAEKKRKKLSKPYSSKTVGRESEAAPDFIPDPPRDPNNKFGVPPSF